MWKNIHGYNNAGGNDVVTFTKEEIKPIIAAYDFIGRSSYERLRARALVLLLRDGAANQRRRHADREHLSRKLPGSCGHS